MKNTDEDEEEQNLFPKINVMKRCCNWRFVNNFKNQLVYDFVFEISWSISLKIN